MFGAFGAEGRRDDFDLESLKDRVLKAWPAERWVPYVEVADTLHEIPWDVQEACLVLVRMGKLIEGDDGRIFKRAARTDLPRNLWTA